MFLCFQFKKKNSEISLLFSGSSLLALFWFCVGSLLPPVDGAGSRVSAFAAHLRGVPDRSHLHHVSNQQHQSLVGNQRRINLSCRLWKPGCLLVCLIGLSFVPESSSFLKCELCCFWVSILPQFVLLCFCVFLPYLILCLVEIQGVFEQQVVDSGSWTP